MSTESLDHAAAAARALAHPARLRIVAMLRSGELCVCQVTAVLGLAPSTVSAHLRELKRAGLVAERRQGRFVHVRLATGGKAPAWIDCALAHTVGGGRVTEDDRLVASLRRIPVDELCRLGEGELRDILDRGASRSRPEEVPP
jgi:DNA-binding transcriptional ArsR family regulator